MDSYIQKRALLHDGPEKVDGSAAYTHDITLPGMLYAKMLHSPYAHAMIQSIDTTEAERLPGVRAVITYKNVPKVQYSSTLWGMVTGNPDEVVFDQYVLEQHLRYMGDEVAAVAADTEEIAAQALHLIRVEYEQLPVILDPLDALKPDAPDIHENRFGKNLACKPTCAAVGDFDKAWSECAVTYEGTFKLPIQKHMCMETSAALAYYTPSGELTVWCNTQATHPVKTILARIFSLDESRVRVLTPPYVGGAFGQRTGLCGKAEVLTVALSRQLCLPVKLVYDRWEETCTTDSRHSGYIYLRMGAKADGAFHALEVNPIVNAGAYVSWGTTISMKEYSFGVNVYRFPNTRHYGRNVYTNILPAGAFRGFGNPQCMFALEAAVDDLARQLGRDPVELRLQNITRIGDPWQMPFPCESTELAKCIRVAADEIGWKEKRSCPQSGTLRRGVGLAVGRHTSTSDASCGVYLRLEQDGSVYLATGISDTGNGAMTALTQVLAESFEIPIERIAINVGDTGRSPWDIGTHSTRALYDRGKAVMDGVCRLKEELMRYVSGLWGVPEEKIHYARGAFSTQGGRLLTLAQLADYATRHGRRFDAIGRAGTSGSCPWHCHGVEAEVDMETGEVKVIKLVAAHDVGVPVNPNVVEGQIEGGVVQGLGYALREELVYDKDGKPYNSSFHAYMLLTAEDIPEIVPIIVEASDPNGPYGAKGVGECPVVPVAAAVAAAVEDATGVRFHEIPLTPTRVLAGIKSGYAVWPPLDCGCGLVDIDTHIVS